MANNSTNLTLFAGFDETGVTIYRLVVEIVTICQLIILPFMLYLIFTQSSKMQTYRFYLLNNLLWSILIEITKCAACPIFQSSPSALIFNGPIVPFVSTGVLFTLLEFAIFCAANYGIFVSVAVAYRVVMLLDIKWMIPFYDKRSSFLIGVVLIQVMNAAAVVSMFEPKRAMVLNGTNMAIYEAEMIDQKILSMLLKLTVYLVKTLCTT